MKQGLAIIFSLFLLFTNSDANCQNQNDIINSSDGEIEIIPIKHATLALKWKQEVIYVDPSGSRDLFSEIAPPTLILITDIHGDHYNQNTLDFLNVKNVPIVAPRAVIDRIGSSYSKLRSLDNFNNLTINGINIEGIPMYNLPETADSRHPKGRGNGYVIEISDQRIYISGDTEDIEEMRTLKKIDLAFVCMNLPYTMDVKAAASAVLAFKPGIVYPFHYRGKDGFEDVQLFKELVSIDNGIEVRIRDWYEKK